MLWLLLELWLPSSCPWLSRATALTQSPCDSPVGQLWAAEETSAPWLSGWSEELELSLVDELELLSVEEDWVSDDSLSVDSEDSVSLDLVSDDEESVVLLEPVSEVTVGVELVGAVKGEPVTANAAPPIRTTVTAAMTIAIFFFMPGPIARHTSIRYRISSN